MLEVLRSYNANALKQVLNSAKDIAKEANASFEVKETIRQMWLLCEHLNVVIEKEIAESE